MSARYLARILIDEIFELQKLQELNFVINGIVINFCVPGCKSYKSMELL